MIETALGAFLLWKGNWKALKAAQQPADQPIL